MKKTKRTRIVGLGIPQAAKTYAGAFITEVSGGWQTGNRKDLISISITTILHNGSPSGLTTCLTPKQAVRLIKKLQSIEAVAKLSKEDSMKTDPLKAALEEMEALRMRYVNAQKTARGRCEWDQQGVFWDKTNAINECLSILRKHMTKPKSRSLSKDKISAKNKNG